MNLKRFIYLDSPGIASLYSQLRGEDVVETMMNMESSRSSRWNLALKAFLGVSQEASSRAKEGVTKKVILRPENMVREIVSSLRAVGKLRCSIGDAIACLRTTQEPEWFETRHPFSMPLRIEECNEMKTVVFFSGFTPFGTPVAGTEQVKMSASLNHFPAAYGGYLGVSGHDAMFFRSLNGEAYSYLVFGSLFRSGEGLQIKPYAISL